MSVKPPSSAGAEPDTGKVIPIPIVNEMRTDYLVYAMSTIVDRALPDVRDGLKPVHRRLLYAMDELGLRPSAATKKCARIVGDAMGKYHPHGDAALYEALVRMAQDFSLRYPLVHGQGNFGSVDGDPPAAMRYTEAKLSNVGDEMLIDLKKGTVDFRPNFDESLSEPSVLPAAVPNLLINGVDGIAVGMATKMAPHNLREVSGAICAYIDNEIDGSGNVISVEELMTHIKGPDFPTGGIIFGRQGIIESYETGRGRLLLRGKFEVETLKNGRELLIFTEIPYKVNKLELIERIGQLIRDKQIDGISGVNDESDRDGMRIVIDLRKGAILKIVINQLFAMTALQTTFSIINLALVRGKPETLGLRDLIRHFVEHRVDVVTRRTKHDLRKAEERAHILEGLITAIQNIDEVVAIIRAAKNVDEAKEKLASRFSLSDAQTQAIVDMQLRRLTNLETTKLDEELTGLKTQIEYYKSLLADSKKLLISIKEETHNIAERFGDERKTEIVAGEAESINIEDMIKKEEMMISISNLGYVKRVPVSAYRSQGRGGKGTLAAKLGEEDFVRQIFVANTHEYVLFITNAGKAYWLKVHELPEGTRTTKGAHIKTILQISDDEDITAMSSMKELSDKQYIFMATSRGVVKKVAASQFANAKTRGIRAISLDDGDKLAAALITNGEDEVVLVSRKAHALRTHEEAIRAMGRAGRGVSGMKLAAEDELAGVLRVTKDETMLLLSEYGFGKRVAFDDFTPHGRGTGGQRIYTVSEKTGEIAGCVNVREDEEIMVLTTQGKSIKVNVSEIRVMGRAASGVRILNIDSMDFVVGVDRIVKDE